MALCLWYGTTVSRGWFGGILCLLPQVQITCFKMLGFCLDYFYVFNLCLHVVVNFKLGWVTAPEWADFSNKITIIHNPHSYRSQPYCDTDWSWIELERLEVTQESWTHWTTSCHFFLPHYCLLLAFLVYSLAFAWFHKLIYKCCRTPVHYKIYNCNSEWKAEEHLIRKSWYEMWELNCTTGGDRWNSKTDTNLSLNRCRDIGEYATIQMSLTLLSSECLTHITYW